MSSTGASSSRASAYYIGTQSLDHNISQRTGIKSWFGSTGSRLNVQHLEQQDTTLSRPYITDSSSIYSADGGLGNYEISGKILLAIWHDHQVLNVEVISCQDLVGVKGGGFSDPYVKLYLLPDHSKSTKRRTRIKKKTNDPTFNEILMILLAMPEIPHSKLLVSVWDADVFGRNLFLGEVEIPLSEVSLTNRKEELFPLGLKVYEDIIEGRGSLDFAVMYKTKKKSLQIKIKRAFNLLRMHPKIPINPFVRVFLLPNQGNAGRKKTKVIKNSVNPVWKEKFEYDNVTLVDLYKRVLEITVWDYDSHSSNEFLGCLRLGIEPHVKNPWMDPTDGEKCIWTGMLERPGKWIRTCQKLRPTIASLNESGPYLDIMDPMKTEKKEVKGQHKITGRVMLKLEYKNEILKIHIRKAENLAAADMRGFSNPFINVSITYNEKTITTGKTNVVSKTVNPVFQEIIEYSLKRADLPSIKLRITAWHKHGEEVNIYLGETDIHLSESSVFGDPQWYPLHDDPGSDEDELM